MIRQAFVFILKASRLGMTPLSEVVQVLDSILEGKALFLFGLLTQKESK